MRKLLLLICVNILVVHLGISQETQLDGDISFGLNGNQKIRQSAGEIAGEDFHLVNEQGTTWQRFSLVDGSGAASGFKFQYTTNGGGNWTDLMSIKYNGYVGIGTTDPKSMLDVKESMRIHRNGVLTQYLLMESTTSGNIISSFGSSKHFLFDMRSGGGYYFRFNGSSKFVINSLGNVGIGTTTPLGKVDIRTATDEVALRLSMPTSEDAAAYDIKWANSNADVVHRIQYASQYYDFMNVNRATRNVTLNGGNVGIGTTTPTYKLTVDGTIGCEEVKVEIIDGADKVFEDDYQLTDLKELEKFVKTNKHLPEIAPEKEMQENGVDMGEFQIQLLQKIEELTLYVIDLKKENQGQKELIQQQHEDYSELKNEIEKLKKLIK